MIPAFEDVMRLTRTISSEPALTDDDAIGLYRALAQVPRGGVVVEIGCELGRSSSLILQMAKAIGFRSIHIDPYEHHADYFVKWAGMMHSIDYPFTFFRSRSIDSFTREGVADICWQELDLLYIDGDHSYMGALLDFDNYSPMLCSGGFLCVHDYGNAGLPEVKAVFDYRLIQASWEHVETTGYLGVWRRK